ncbi:hypothetical protein [Pseudofrankia sp. BMG5.36]|nr:hypothetical protein [Pseudofrankia sp. BMG5.36]
MLDSVASDLPDSPGSVVVVAPLWPYRGARDTTPARHDSDEVLYRE